MRRGTSVVRVVAALTAAAGMAACSAGSGSTSARPSARATSPPPKAATLASTPSPSVSTPCDTPGMRATTIVDAAGRRRLEAAVVGSGSTTVVFVHESGSQGMCGFADFAAWIARTRRARALLVEQCGYGLSRCPDMSEAGTTWIGATRVAIAWARSHGARRVVVVGASYGGTVALAVGTGTPRVDAVADLSGERDIGGLDAVRLARAVAVPLVLGVAPGDRYVSVEEMRAVADAATRTRPVLLVSDVQGAHGWELLQDGPATWSPVAEAVAALV